MKRNPLYTPPQAGKSVTYLNGLTIKVPHNSTFETEVNGFYTMNFQFKNGGMDAHGDVIMPGAFKKQETKQDKFIRIFDVVDAVII